MFEIHGIEKLRLCAFCRGVTGSRFLNQSFIFLSRNGAINHWINLQLTNNNLKITNTFPKFVSLGPLEKSTSSG